MKTKKYSPITWVFERLFWMFQFLPPQLFIWLLVQRRLKLSPEQIWSPDVAAKRARAVEVFVMVCVALDALAFGALFSGQAIPRLLAVAWAALRIVDILQAIVNVTLFDGLRATAPHHVASFVRLVVLGYVNFMELIVNFASIYGAFPEHLKGSHGPWDALYFSVITQLTIGYGDIVPESGLRAVVVVQALGGLAFLALVFARTISALPGIRQIIDGKEEEPGTGELPRN